MSTESKPPSDAPAAHTHAAKKGNVWDRMVQDWRDRPGFYGTLIVLVGVAIAATVFLQERTATQDLEASKAFSEAMTKAAEQEDLAKRVQVLQQLAQEYQGKEFEANALLTLAQTAQNAAQQADSPKEKLGFYRAVVAATERFASAFPDSTLRHQVSNPMATDPNSALPPMEAMAANAKSQVAFLQEFEALSVDPEVDPGFKAVITFAKADGSEIAVEVEFYSSLAPVAVDHFLRMVKEGKWAQTLTHGLVMNDADEISAVAFGSALSRVAPEAKDAFGGEADRVGFTLPEESSPLASERGKIAFAEAKENNRAVGTDPAQVLIITADAMVPTGTIFGQIRNADDVIGQLVEALAPMEAAEGEEARELKGVKEPLTVKSVTVEGTPKRAPLQPAPWAWQDPTAPEK